MCLQADKKNRYTYYYKISDGSHPPIQFLSRFFKTSTIYVILYHFHIDFLKLYLFIDYINIILYT